MAFVGPLCKIINKGRQYNLLKPPWKLQTALEGKTRAAAPAPAPVRQPSVGPRRKKKEPINTGGGGWGLILLGEQSRGEGVGFSS